MMTDHDARQLFLMKEMIDAFDKKEIGLVRLISSLDGLQNALEDVEGEWRSAFLKQWGVLEDVYADMADKKVVETPKSYVSLLESAIREIRHLIAEMQPD